MAGRFCTERQLCFVFYTDNEAAIVTIQQPLSRKHHLTLFSVSGGIFLLVAHEKRRVTVF